MGCSRGAAAGAEQRPADDHGAGVRVEQRRLQGADGVKAHHGQAACEAQRGHSGHVRVQIFRFCKGNARMGAGGGCKHQRGSRGNGGLGIYQMELMRTAGGAAAACYFITSLLVRIPSGSISRADG